MILETGPCDLIPVQIGEAWSALMVARTKAPENTDCRSLDEWRSLRLAVGEILQNLTGSKGRNLAEIDDGITAILSGVHVSPENERLRMIASRIQEFAGKQCGHPERTQAPHGSIPVATWLSADGNRKARTGGTPSVSDLRAVYLENAGYANYPIDDDTFETWLKVMDERGRPCLYGRNEEKAKDEWICLGAVIRPLDGDRHVWRLKRRNNQLLGRAHRKLRARIVEWGADPETARLRARVDEVERILTHPRKRLLNAISNATSAPELNYLLEKLLTGDSKSDT